MAEEIEQLDHQSGTPPLVLHLPYTDCEMSHDSSSTHVTSDELPVDTTLTEWLALVGQSLLMSPLAAVEDAVSHWSGISSSMDNL